MAAEPSAGASEFAPAKLNLSLHLRGRRPDGYHLLDSLVVFPGIGDRLSVEDGTGLSLSLGGPFGDALPADGDNLVLRAAAGLAGPLPDRGAAIRLEKTLPIASGIGGGSADAAAALRLLVRHWGCAMPEGLALRLGADVPVCLASTPQIMQGIGEQLTPAPRMPGFWAVLVNPMVSVPTGAVFAAVERRDNPPGPAAPREGWRDLAALRAWLTLQRNDLEPAAIRCCPIVAEVLEALAEAPLARMSGSGATCFALHETEAAALAAADRLRGARPGWWVAAAPVPPWQPAAAPVQMSGA
ncbi:MAG: 4-(cytidine 5'-diphospho)-2-C-methyl-D-erythritol kinase [Pseudomonadota bacterium]